MHQLKKLPGFNERREILAAKFFAYIDQIPFLLRPEVHPLARPSWFALALTVTSDAPFSRQEITGFFENVGIETRPVVSGNIARHPVAQVFKDIFAGSYPGADIVHDRSFYIGLSPLQDDGDMDRVLEYLRQFLSEH